MAKKYAAGDKSPHNKNIHSVQITEGEQTYPLVTKTWVGIIFTLALLFIVTLSGSVDKGPEKWTGLLAGVLTLVILFLAARGANLWKRAQTPLFLAFSAYVIWGGISTFYAASGKFAISEFSKLLVAFCIYLAFLFLTGPSERGFRRVSYIVSALGGIYGIVSVDAASWGVFSKIFKVIFGVFTPSFANRGAFESGIRTSGIFGNPDFYAGFMAIAVLLSLYLVLHATNKKGALISTCLLAVNSLAYLLVFAFGSLFMFLIACIVMIVFSEKNTRISAFLLMIETAVLGFIFAIVSMAGLGKTGAVTFIPILALILNAAILSLLDGGLRPAISRKLSGNVKLLRGTVILIVVLIAGYGIAAFSVSGSLSLNPQQSVIRAIYVPGGDYSLKVDSSAPVNVTVESQNNYDLMRHTSATLFAGTNEKEVSFNVPEDSRIVTITFTAPDSNIEVINASYTGAETGTIHLKYPLLPEIIANRVQNLFANENAVQRTIFFDDGIKLFKKSPLIGRGLGGFENGVYSVQDFYYETKYAHNHYIQVLSDLGIIGLILFLAVLGSAAMAVVRSRRHGRALYATPVLAASIVQMFGQAVTDVIWSAGAFLGFAAAVLAMITLFCGEPLGMKGFLDNARLRVAEKIVLGVFTGIFVVLLTGNLYAQEHAKTGVKSFDDFKTLITLDRFEHNDYKVSYLLNAPQSGNPAVVAQADIYAKELLKVESNSLAPYIMSYYFATSKDDAAFEAAKSGIRYAKSSPSMWTRIFNVFEDNIDPVSPNAKQIADRLKTPAAYVNGVLEIYDTLLERNKNSLDHITLSPNNEAFLGKLMEIKAKNLQDQESVLTALVTDAFDSRYAVDADLDGLPDNLTIKSGSVLPNQDGALTVKDHTEIDLTLYPKMPGNYTFTIKTNAPQGIKIAIDGKDQNVLYAGGDTASVTISLGQDSVSQTSNIHVIFPTAAVIDQITYRTSLE